MLPIASFSDLLFEMEELAHVSSIDEFQTSVLSAVQRIMPFDKAWWGIMAPDGSSFSLHSSHLFGLPSSYVSAWEDVRCEDLVAQAVALRQNETVYFDQAALRAAPGLESLTGDHGIGQAFCTSSRAQTQPSFMFLSLYRSFGEPEFSNTDRLLVQYLVRHLFCLWANNRSCQMQQLKSAFNATRHSMAIADRQCEILNAEPDFQTIMKLEWQAWDGGPLPKGVAKIVAASYDVPVRLERIVVRSYRLGDFTVLVVRRRLPADSLSSREAVVAEQFGAGSSYKEIAKQIGLSPATVRHHLRGIYCKLGVRDKGEMSAAVRDQDDWHGQDELIGRYRNLQGRAAPV